MRRLPLLLLLVALASSQSLSNSNVCELRCIAACINKSKEPIESCQTKCRPYSDPSLCDTPECWQQCRDLGPKANMAPPKDVKFERLNTGSLLSWSPVSNATLYAVQYKKPTDPSFVDDNYELVLNTSIPNFQNPKGTICDQSEVRILSVAPRGVSEPSKVKIAEAPTPNVSPALQVAELLYLDRPFQRDNYEANGTLKLTFKFQSWPLGDSDIIVDPLFHMVNCALPDLSKAVPVPEFVPGPDNTIVGFLGADMMYRRCRFVYYAQSVTSQQCGTENFFHYPPGEAIQTMVIDCDTVKNAPCQKVVRHEPPVCGQVGEVQYKVMNNHVKSTDNLMDLILNVTFEPEMRSNEPPTIYYVAFYGPAVNFESEEQRVFLGVNLTQIMANTTNCYNFTQEGYCSHSTNNSVFLQDIHMDNLYGVTFCAVKDPENLSFPDFFTDKSLRPKANPIYVDSKAIAPSKTGLIIGIVAGALTLIVICLVLLCLYFNKKQKDKNNKFRLKINQLEMEKEKRYTDFPKKFDIWEIERRNLIIHNDKKLGSGAFGAVYLGKLLGKSFAHKDAQSPLGVNLMRAENCEVAVKMLPEYADELSKSEFLREIGLMKTLGYHERLVNMLACVTDSEPLCLVVEYCSDGDLLQFLRTRCKYMMKLDELGVDYHQPPVTDNYDVAMIITMKQLLMFAVQISYGLEYLSQKGFVHRDVAARNILVHEKTSCKIGDFGLCRYVYAESSHYKSKGGRLPLKWMSPEAIRHYEFSAQSDVWSFGILLFEVITLGGSPYPGVQPEDMLTFLEGGGRMEQPDNCPDEFYDVMTECWRGDPETRPEFQQIRQKLATQLEEVSEEYSYLKLDAQKDYYNVQYGDQKPDIIIVPDSDATVKGKQLETSSIRSIESIPRDPVIFDPNEDIDRVKAAIKRNHEEEDTQSSVINDSISISMGAISEANDV